MKHLLSKLKLFSAAARHLAVVRVTAAALMAAVMVAVPAAPALAQPPAPAPPAPGQVRQGDRLERLFNRELRVLDREQKALERAGQRAARIQERIDNLKSQGKDTSKLEEALADFRAGIASAQSFFNAAKGILDARAGFDANGNVVDLAAARGTVREAGKAERQFFQAMRKAVRELLRDIREYRKSTEPKAPGTEQRREKAAGAAGRVR